jgi:hypothetical protein
MDLLSILSFAAADLAYSILDLSGLQVAATSLIALVPPGGYSAVRADAFYISIGEESGTSRAIGQFDLSGIDVSVLEQGRYDLLGPMVAFRVVSIAEEIEVHVHILKYLIEVSMIFGHQLLGRDPRRLSIDNNWSSVCISAANEQHISAHLSQAPDENVRRHIGPEVAYMTRPVGIGQAAGDKDTIASWRQ